MKYLIATDGSANANACVQDLGISKLTDQDLIKVIAVWEERRFAVIPAKLDKEKAEAIVADTVNTLKSLFGERVSGECLRGDTVACILQEVEAWQADKVLIGAHGYSLLPEALIGDTCKAVLHKSKKSVVVYRPDPKGNDKSIGKKVLWCVDSAPLAARVFSMLSNQIDLPDGAELKLLHILLSSELSERQGHSHETDDVSQRVDELRTSIQKLMDELIQKVLTTRPDIKTSTEIVEDPDAVAGILKYSSDWQADLIVTGAHNYSLGERILLGSVSEEVARRAKCSVQVVR